MDNIIKDVITSIKFKNPKKLNEFLNEKLNNKKVVIYGAGAFGKEIFNVLKSNNIKVDTFLDKNQIGTLFDIPIYNPSEYENKDVIIILSIVLYKHSREEIINFLNSLNFYHIIDAQEIRARYVYIENNENNHTYDYFISNIEKILKPLSFLEDQESKEAYKSAICAHISRDYSNCYESNEKAQYFLENIDYKKDFSQFVDCGAYSGDTYEELQKKEKFLQKYIGFEPNKLSFNKLNNRVSQDNIEALLLPLGVSDKLKEVRFNYNLGSSCVDNNGEEIINCVGLDDVLINLTPTFVKMDIEGEEINALNGAKNLITKAKPDLAICVYHYIDHFWKIPNLIYSWNLDYKFYLRTHSSACMETVLYAFRKDK